MLKRLIILALAAVMLALLAPALVSGEGAEPLATAADAPYQAQDGEIAVAVGTNGNELLACFLNDEL